jgi:hypothetical protein
MSPVLRTHGVLARMALSSRQPSAWMIVLSFAAVAAVTIGFLVQLKMDDPMLSIGVAARIALAGLLAGWAGYFLPGAIKLNTPANARLVPALRRRLMQLTAGAWAAATLLAALLAVGTGLAPSLVLLGAGGGLATFALARTGHWAGVAAQFGLFPLVALSRVIPASALDRLAHGAGLAAASLLMLAYGAFTLRTMFMNGGERHYALRERQKLQTERLTPKGQFREGKPNRVFTAVYLAALRRDCAGRDAGKLLGHLLGAREHWSGQLLALAVVTPVLGGALLALRFYDGDALRLMVANGGWVVAASLMLVPLFDHERRNIRLMETRGEQTLLRLAPAMPAGAAAFNRTLAGVQLRSAVLGWCLQAGAVGLLTLAAGAPASFYVLQLCLCCLTLPLIGTNLRQHARHAGLLGLGPAFALLVTAAISFAAGAAIHAVSGLPITAGAALASVLIALVVVPWRWKRSVAAPIAFPVGRLA